MLRVLSICFQVARLKRGFEREPLHCGLCGIFRCQPEQLMPRPEKAELLGERRYLM